MTSAAIASASEAIKEMERGDGALACCVAAILAIAVPLDPAGDHPIRDSHNVYYGTTLDPEIAKQVETPQPPSNSASVSATISVARKRSASGRRSSARCALASSIERGPAPKSTIGTPAFA
jgi:hypothetical protein